jgi:HEAT repeat protein
VSPTLPYLLPLLAVFFVWLSLSAWVVADRIAYDRRLSALREGFTGQRWWRMVARIAADPSSDSEHAEALARYVLRTDEQAVLDAARDKRMGWRTVEAVRILARADHPESYPALEQLLANDDEEVTAAAATILGEMRHEQATLLLINALQTQACPARWVSALLERRKVPVRLLRPLLDDSRPGVREAAIRLLAKSKVSDGRVDPDLLELCDDPVADVRAAAARALGERRSPNAVNPLESLLADPVWFVQVQAARSLGRLHSAGSAGRITKLLASPRWWVRQAAKDALVELGPDVRAELVPLLDHPDPFARNSCAEVLQNLGVVDDLVAEASKPSNTSRPSDAAVLLRKILTAGGSRVEEAVISGVGPELREELAAISQHTEDSSTPEVRAA